MDEMQWLKQSFLQFSDSGPASIRLDTAGEGPMRDASLKAGLKMRAGGHQVDGFNPSFIHSFIRSPV